MRLIRYVSKPRMRWTRSPALGKAQGASRHAVARAPPRDEVTAHKTAYPANGTLSEDGNALYASGTPRTTTS